MPRRDSGRGRKTRSVWWSSARPIFIASSSCENCDSSGLDLTGVSVSGADLRGANLSGATLNRTILREPRSLVGHQLRRSDHHLQRLLRYRAGTRRFDTDRFLHHDLQPGHLLVSVQLLKHEGERRDSQPRSLASSRSDPCDDNPVSHSTGGRPELEPPGNGLTVTDGGSLQGAHLANASPPPQWRGIDMRGVVLSGSDTERRGFHRKPHRRQQSRGRALSGRDAARCDRIQHRRLGRSRLHRSPPRRGRGSSRPSSRRSPWTG